MIDITSKFKAIFAENKAKIISLIVFCVAIIPGLWMPKLRQPPLPQVLGTADISIPNMNGFANNLNEITNTANDIKIKTGSTFKNITENAELIAKPAKMPTPSSKDESNPLMSIKEDNQLFKINLNEKRSIISKDNSTSIGMIAWEEGNSKEIYSDKYEVGSVIKITFGNKTIPKTINANRPIGIGNLLVVNKAVFGELGINADQYKEASVKVEQN